MRFSKQRVALGTDLTKSGARLFAVTGTKIDLILPEQGKAPMQDFEEWVHRVLESFSFQSLSQQVSTHVFDAGVALVSLGIFTDLHPVRLRYLFILDLPRP